MKDSETRVWLLRHPETDESVRGRCYGSLDIGLSPDGIRQAEKIAKALAGENFAAIYSSPSLRCVKAAAELAAGRQCGVEIVDGLREMNFGDFEGRTYEEIAAIYPEIYRQWMERPTDARFPGGEGFVDMVDRVCAAERELRAKHDGRSIALITHGGVIRIILGKALGMDLDNIFRIGQRYGAVNIVKYFGGAAVVELMNGEAGEFGWRRERDSELPDR